MKRLLFIVVFLFSVTISNAATVIVSWEPNPVEEQIATYEVGLLQMGAGAVLVEAAGFNPMQSWSTYETSLTLPDTATRVGSLYQVGVRAVNIYGMYSDWQVHSATGEFAVVDLRAPSPPGAVTIIIQTVQ